MTGVWVLKLRNALCAALAATVASGATAKDPVWRHVDATLDEGFQRPISVEVRSEERRDKAFRIKACSPVKLSLCDAINHQSKFTSEILKP